MSSTSSKRYWSTTLAAVLAALSMSAVAAFDAQAQRAGNQEEEEEASSDRVFSPEVGEIVVAAQEKMSAEPPDNRGALADLDRAAGQRNLSAYELGVVMYMRGGLKYQLDDVQGALADWNRAINEGDLGPQERLSVMFNVGQLYLSEGNYREAVTRIQQWLDAGGQPNDGVHLNLVAAYVELGEWQNALRHARSAYEIASPRQKRHYDTLNYLYTEMDMPAERAAILSEMVEIFPTDKNVWLSIAALHAQAGREQKAFEINKIMYLNGMMTTEEEIMRIVDYYSYYEVPFRGARILEREMNAGRVERDQENLEKLARLYRQANEFDRAIPPLEAAARMSPNGELFQTLGEAYYAEAMLGEAEGALTQAINRGGLDSPGDVWIVIGNARYEAGNREGAVEAFREGEAFNASRDTARDWREFVEREIDQVRERSQFAVDVMKEEVRVSCRRQLADIIIYQERANAPGYDGPDCPAVVNDDDFSSVPDVMRAQAEVDAEFPPTDRPPVIFTEGDAPAGAPASPEGEATDGEDAEAEEAAAPAAAGNAGR